MNVIDEKIKPTCGNCRFVFHLSDDPKELERCKLIRQYNRVKINPLAEEYCERNKSSDLCEYHQTIERLKNRVDYSL